VKAGGTRVKAGGMGVKAGGTGGKREVHPRKWLLHPCKRVGFLKQLVVGIDYAGEDALLPRRFYIKGNPYISGPMKGL